MKFPVSLFLLGIPHASIRHSLALFPRYEKSEPNEQKQSIWGIPKNNMVITPDSTMLDSESLNNALFYQFL
jgi:hypothetical protein